MLIIFYSNMLTFSPVMPNKSDYFHDNVHFFYVTRSLNDYHSNSFTVFMLLCPTFAFLPFLNKFVILGFVTPNVIAF